MHRIDRLARIALAMDKTDVHGRMPDQQPDHFPAGITGTPIMPALTRLITFYYVDSVSGRRRLAAKDKFQICLRFVQYSMV